MINISIHNSFSMIEYIFKDCSTGSVTHTPGMPDGRNRIRNLVHDGKKRVGVIDMAI